MKLLSLFIVGLNFSRRKSHNFHPYSQVNRINRREIKLNDFDLGINRCNNVISYKIKTNPTTFIKTPSLYDIKEKQPTLKARTSVVSQAQSELTSLCRQFDNLASISEEPLCEKIKKYIISYKAPNPVLGKYIDHLSKRFISFFNEDKFYIITFTVFIVVISNGLENFTASEHESDGNILSEERYKVNFSISDVSLAALKWRGLSFRTTDHYKALETAISLLGLQEISSDENLRKMRTKFTEGLDFFLKK